MPSNLETIEERAFASCTKLESITIPETVTSIEESAFSNCDTLESLHIPAGVTSLSDSGGPIGSNAKLTTITVDANNPVYDSRDNCNAIIETGTNTLICGCQGTVIPASVQTLGDYSFSSCEGLKEIKFGSGTPQLSFIKHAVFCWCPDLEEAVLPAGVKEMGQMTFQQCEKLKTATIGFGLTELDSTAFTSSTALESVTLPSSIQKIGSNTFYGCSALQEVKYQGDADMWNKIECSSSAVDLDSMVTYVDGDINIADVDQAVLLDKDGNEVDSYTITGEDFDLTAVASFRGSLLREGYDFTTSLGPVNGDSANVILTGKGSFYGTKEISIKVSGNTTTPTTETTSTTETKPTTTTKKAANTLTVKAKKVYKVAFKKLKKKAIPVKRAKVMTVSKAKGKLTYKLVSVKKAKFKKFFNVNAKTGNIKLKKKLKKGTYKVTIKVTAAGNSSYKAASRKVTVKIKVK